MGPFSCCMSSSVVFKSTSRGQPACSSKRIRVFTHEELASATSGFSPTSLLGRGSHGSVFLASLDRGRLKAAVKLPSPSSYIQYPSAADSEIDLLSSMPRSPLLVNLVGATSPNGPPPRIAVVDLMPRGSLHELLHNPLQPSPPFALRLRLALRAAAALAHLHLLRVAHRDVKPSNFLLDSKGRPRLADFGLALRLPLDNAADSNYGPSLPPPAGTMGYLDPGYVRPEDVSTKIDVYSFGVVLLEILSGRRAIDVDYSPPSLVDWAVPLVAEERFSELWDPTAAPAAGEEEKAAKEVATVASRCVATADRERPSMTEVVSKLREAERRVGRPRLSRLVRIQVKTTPSSHSSSRNRKVSNVAR